eukprot:12916309-Prorocentrum_lima.AAC.1
MHEELDNSDDGSKQEEPLPGRQAVQPFVPGPAATNVVAVAEEPTPEQAHDAVGLRLWQGQY